MKALVLYIICLSLPLQSYAAVTAGNGPVDQREGQHRAEKIESDGADDSMEHATTRAMIALGCLAALAIGCAFANGFKAFDHYLNSEDMNRVEAKAKSLKGTMDSLAKSSMLKTKAANSGPSGNGKNDSWVSFSRLDPGFLYKGEAGQVAEEFEKRSGLKREQFLGVLSKITDSDLSFDDPNLYPKANSIWSDFVSKVPNQEFKEGLLIATDMIPEQQRQQVFNDALGKVYAMGSNRGTDQKQAERSLTTVNEKPAPETVTTSGPPVIATKSGLNSASASSEVKKDSSVTADQRIPGKTASQAFGMFIGLESKDRSPLDGLIQASRSNAEDDGSIFTKISRRYRLIAPSLQSGVKSVN